MLACQMPADREEDITGLILLWRAGNKQAEARLFELVIPDLHRIAYRLIGRERQNHTLQPTELVSQVYLKLVKAKDRNWVNRKHFFALAARAMRNYLVDYSRQRPRAELVSLDALPFEGCASLNSDPDTLISISRLLDKLAETDADACSLVELRYFLGLTDAETAELLGMNVRTVQRRWQDARRWLFLKLQGNDCANGAIA